MNNKKRIGNIGEELASKYLEKNGYTIDAMNFYSKYGEIDIVAKFEETIIFVEVKTRTNLLCGHPIESISYRKKNHLKNTARYYLFINKTYNLDIRFDAIEVYLKDHKYKINHIKDIID